MKYRIICPTHNIKDEYSNNLICYLLQLNEENIYQDKLKNCFFHRIDHIESKLLDIQSIQKDNNKYVYLNELTLQKSSIEVKKYEIIIECINKRNIFFDIIYHNLKNYVIIVET